jgi:hypothetical protein
MCSYCSLQLISEVFFGVNLQEGVMFNGWDYNADTCQPTQTWRNCGPYCRRGRDLCNEDKNAKAAAANQAAANQAAAAAAAERKRQADEQARLAREAAERQRQEDEANTKYAKSKVDLGAQLVNQDNNIIGQLTGQKNIAEFVKTYLTNIKNSLIKYGLPVPSEIDANIRTLSDIGVVSSVNINIDVAIRDLDNQRLGTTNTDLAQNKPAVAAQSSNNIPNTQNTNLATPDWGKYYQCIQIMYGTIILVLQKVFGFPSNFNFWMFYLIHYLYFTAGGPNTSTLTFIDQIDFLNKKMATQQFIVVKSTDEYILMNEIYKRFFETWGRNFDKLLNNCISSLVANGITTTQLISDQRQDLKRFGLNETNQDNFEQGYSIFWYMNKFNLLYILFHTPTYTEVTQKYSEFKMNDKSNLSNFLNYCYKFNINESGDNNSMTFDEFTKSLIIHDIKYDLFFKLIDTCTNQLNGGLPFYKPKNISDFSIFLAETVQFDKSNQFDLIKKISDFKTALNNVFIYNYIGYTAMLTTLYSKVYLNTDTDTMDNNRFIKLFTEYYNTRKCIPGTEEQFRNSHPVLADVISSRVPFNEALSRFLTEFDGVLQFTNNEQYCFGVFINNILNVSKKYMSQFEIIMPPENRPMRYIEYSYIEGKQDGSSEPFVSSGSQQMSNTDTISSMITSFNQFINYVFYGTSSKSEPRNSKQPKPPIKEGISYSMAGLGVIDTTTQINVGQNRMVEGDKGLYQLIVDKLGMTKFEDVQKTIRFVRSIGMPLPEADNTFDILRAFGVNGNNFLMFITKMSELNIGNYAAFKMILPKLVSFGVTMENLESFVDDAMLIKVDISKKETSGPAMIANISPSSIDGSQTTLNRLLDILLMYNITYRLSSDNNIVYDKCNTKFTNFTYNLSLDGITATQFLTFAPTFLKALTLGENGTNGKYEKYLRDLIVNRTNFFIKQNDVTPYGSFAELNLTCPEDNPSNQYSTSTGALINPNWNLGNPAPYAPLFSVTDQSNENGLKYFKPKLNLHTGAELPVDNNTILAFYTNIVPAVTTTTQDGTVINNLNVNDYCNMVNCLDDAQFKYLKQNNMNDDTITRQLISSVLVKMLKQLNDLRNNTTPSAGASQELLEANIVMYNNMINSINMLLLFPQYTLFLLTKYINEPVCDTCRKVNEASQGLYLSGISSYLHIGGIDISETFLTNDSNTPEYSIYK